MFKYWRHESLKRLADSATSYELANISVTDYAPTTPFKGVHIGGAGNLVIEGLDGVQATLAVGAGTYAFGGQKIIKVGTTATLIYALR